MILPMQRNSVLRLYKIQEAGTFGEPTEVKFGNFGGPHYFCDAEVAVAKGDVLEDIEGGARSRVISASQCATGSYKWLEVKVEQLAANEPFARASVAGVTQNIYGNVRNNAAVVNITIDAESIGLALTKKAEELSQVEGKQSTAQKLKDLAIDRVLVPIIAGVLNEHIRQYMSR